MLWIEKYRPKSFEEIRGQDHVVSHLKRAARSGDIPHLLLTGPPGTGKSVAVECLAYQLYGDRMAENMTVIQTADLFEQGKKYLEGDERYGHLYQREQSLLSNFKNIVRWYASIRPLDSDFRIIVFEGASAMTREAQQGIRRIMERYSRTCRFIFVTSRPSALIPAISSRCLPFFFVPVESRVVGDHLHAILASEFGDTSPLSDDDTDLIVQAAAGDMRKAVVLLQVSTGEECLGNLIRCSQTETGQIAQAALTAVSTGDMISAVRRFETLMIEYGLTSREILHEFRTAVRREYNDPRLSIAIADTDYTLTHGNNEYLQLNAMLARIIAEVFS
ncbi:MAG TPA: AAA family ATPase [Methanoregulaceae archaeon]|nr:AAA family ATPase [Burkholderiaceae bacterium]HNJ80699.1 AAA family ATPase [Methanoregulaceae archaeon]HNL85925.1 AAA family ATPase [Methanoregulaceae archaeon]HPS22824.1 AAA family ATPase [Methanoregulaceae archaeon]